LLSFDPPAQVDWVVSGVHIDALRSGLTHGRKPQYASALGQRHCLALREAIGVDDHTAAAESRDQYVPEGAVRLLHKVDGVVAQQDLSGRLAVMEGTLLHRPPQHAGGALHHAQDDEQCNEREQEPTADAHARRPIITNSPPSVSLSICVA
jgi:hypothetical protein